VSSGENHGSLSPWKKITLDVYTQAVNSNKRSAQSKVVTMMVSDVGQKREEKYPQTV
jgi:hypothetical protein